jgi:hypothetical protein
MPATLRINELPDEIAIRVTEPRKYNTLFFAPLIGAFVAYFFLRTSQLRAFQVAIGLLLAFGLARDLISSLRGTDVRLRIGNLDLVSSGRAPGRYTPTTIPRADIYNLEYRDAFGDGDSMNYPQGIYVEYRDSGRWQLGQCILPHVTQIQAQQVIEAIYMHFPDTGTADPGGPFETDLISLNLNHPSKQ